MIEQLTLSPCERQLSGFVIDLIDLLFDAVRLGFQ